MIDALRRAITHVAAYFAKLGLAACERPVYGSVSISVVIRRGQRAAATVVLWQGIGYHEKTRILVVMGGVVSEKVVAFKIN